MKSVKTKIIILVLSFVILSSVSIGVVSYVSSLYVVDQDSTQIMNLLCENKTNNFNEIFKRIKQSTETLESTVNLAINNMDETKTQEENLNNISNMLLPISITSAKSTESVVAVYLRFDPNFIDSQSGFFYVKDEKTNTFNKEEPTDLNLYSPSDRERVAWFYEPKEVGKSVWIEPYYNKNIEKQMISYVIPIYMNKEFIGVIGMDVDFKELVSIVSNTSIYDSGYAFLANDKAQIVYHEQLEYGTDLTVLNNGEFKEMAQFLFDEKKDDNLIKYTYGGVKKEATFRSLENGMRFILTAPKSQIVSQADSLLNQMLLGVLIVIMIAVVLTFVFAKKLVKPLLELSSAAKKIAEGDLSVSITHQSKDEVGELAESFRQTVVHLDQHFKNINDLAYKDALSGVKNKMAYIEAEDQINEKIREGTASFSLVVFDLNDLKTINDTMGHDVGDLFIIGESRVITSSFKEYPVYRIGGDEFVVLMEEGTYEDHQKCVDAFAKIANSKEKEHSYQKELRIAYGMAHFDQEKDVYFNDVFKRADKAMYECKKEMKR